MYFLYTTYQLCFPKSGIIKKCLLFLMVSKHKIYKKIVAIIEEKIYIPDCTYLSTQTYKT